MKYAREVIELMSAYPERRFRMQDLVRYVAPQAEGGDRQRVRNGILRVLGDLARAGSIEREGGEERGTFGLYWWGRKVPHAVVGKCHAECHNSPGGMRPQ